MRKADRRTMTKFIENVGALSVENVTAHPRKSLAKPPVAILAGGLGTRLSEETAQRPKPLVEVGGKPVIWHVMKHYEAHGMTEFAIALGYKKEAVIRYFLDLHTSSSNLTVRTRDGSVSFHDSTRRVDWTIHLIDTGPETMTGGRIKRLQPYVGSGTFMLTWCDGLSNVDLDELLTFHRGHGKLATVTVVRAPSRFGLVDLARDGAVQRFSEKPAHGEGWINGAFFVLEPGIFDYIAGDATMWEREPLEKLAVDGQLVAYRHTSFWQCMDTLREKTLLDEMWRSGAAPWKTWDTWE
jgi:glucose-1-phosphate cytidylyltransferase